jgi:tetratricopeptide (TPR) repeat protein
VESALGSLYTETGAYDKARDQVSKLLQSDPKNIKALWQMGVIEIVNGNPQAALEPLNKGLSLAVQMDAQELKALILQSMGISYRLMNKPDDAMRSYQDAMVINRRLGLKRNLAGNLVEMALVENSQGKPDAALASYNQALQLQREIGIKKEVGDTLNDMGVVYQAKGDYDEALQKYKESLQIQRDTGDENYEALCLNNIGGIYLAKGDSDNALTYLQQALQLREKLNTSAAIAETLGNIGQVYSSTGQYDQALSTSMRSLDLWRKAGNARGAAYESHDIGLVFQYQGRFGAAVNAMQDAVNGYRAVGDRSDDMAELLIDLAGALARAGRGSESEALLQEAQTIAHGLHNSNLQTELLRTQGDVQLYRGDRKVAKTFYDQAVRSASRATEPGDLLISRLRVAEAAMDEGNNPSALREFRNLAQQADSRNLKYLSLESSADLAEAMIHSKDYSHAQQELQMDLGKSERLGARYLSARIHYLLGDAYRLKGNGADAPGHYRQALSLIEDMRKDPGAEKLLERADLKSMSSEASRFAAAQN